MQTVAHVFGRFAGSVPVIVRVIIGALLFMHGLDKLSAGPAGFAQFLGGELGLPAAPLLAWLVTLLELVGGAMLVVGLATRLIALLATLELLAAIALVTGALGVIAAPGQGVGYERDLAYIAGLLTVLLLGPGRPSLDHLLGLETEAPELVAAPARS